MTGSGDRAADAALWRRWRLDARSAPGAAAPDPLLLAAYAEGRLSEAEAEPVEDWLSEHPDALDDLQTAAAAGEAALPASPDLVVLRAAALVAGRGGAAPGQVVPFPLAAVQRRRAWRTAAAWGGLAASLLVTSLVGFGIGNDTYVSIAGQPVATESAGHALLDPPSSLYEDEEPDT